MLKIKRNLVFFLKELESAQPIKKPSILFATKYLNKQQFVSFIKLLNSFNLRQQKIPSQSPLQEDLLQILLQRSKFLIGENRVQDAQEKLKYLIESPQGEALRKTFTFCMIGNLQKNKINKALPIFDEIHSVDSVELAQELNKKLINRHPELVSRSSANEIPNQVRNDKESKARFPIFLEVNLSGESTKHGFKKKELDKAISTMKQFNNLAIKGLMTMPPPTRNPENNRPYFHKLRLITNRYKLKASMGTSQDWKIAVEEGADIIRVGSAIFNPPKPSPS